jgi:hypothetical protein
LGGSRDHWIGCGAIGQSSAAVLSASAVVQPGGVANWPVRLMLVV